MKEIEKYLCTYESVNIQVPNEIFKDFENGFKTYSHKCFAYSFYYLTTYLYRNAVFGNFDMDKYNMKSIAKILTSSYTNLGYVIKKGGVLDKLGYTETTTNYPISFTLKNQILEFILIKDFREVGDGVHHSPRFSVKKPLLALVRFDDEHYSGTFYDFQNTHKIDVNAFIRIISDKELGSVGFFIYAYLKMMNDKFPEGYQISNQKLSEIVGCSKGTIIKYMTRLEGIKVLESRRKIYQNRQLEKIYTVK